jgi:cytochrome c-type biogenesis protein CcmH
MDVPLLALVVLMAVGAPSTDPIALEREARQLETMLIAPCCWMQPVSQHQSQASDEVKQQIRVLLAAGKTRQEVLDAFVVQYGPRILAEPPAEGVGRLLYVGLPLAFVLSAAALVLYLRRTTVRPPTSRAPTEALEASDDAYAARLDDELRDMD